MGIGDFSNSNNGNNNQKQTDNTYYSRMRFRTKDGKRSLSCSFWSGLMILSIDDVDVNNGFKPNSLEVIRLSANKAKILYREILALEKYIESGEKIDPNKAFGVTSGLGNEVPYIGFSCADDENKTIYVTIGRINNSGDILSAQTMGLDNAEYFYGLQWSNISKMEVERDIYYHLELEMLKEALSDFAAHMNGALGYSVLDIGRYDLARVNRKFDSIFDKLGIEKYNSGQRNYGSNGGNSFLNNLASKNSTSTSIDDLGDLLDD